MAQAWDTLAVLVDPTRRGLFEYVQHAGHPVARDEAADALHISRGLAAFHLDKLVDAGLLGARYEAPAELPRGRGRTPKVYEPAAGDLALSVPEREYGLAAQILADAVADDPAHADAAVRHHARRHGREVGTRMRSLGADLPAALASVGFHPHPGTDRILLSNCPFHALAASQTELICGLNLEFVAGLIDAIGAPGCRARLAPAPERCCVEIVTGTGA